MNKIASNIVSGVIVALLTTTVIGGFGMYTDIVILKQHAHSTDEALRANSEAGKEFMKTLSNINATLAAQTEAINHLKEAVRSNDASHVLAYNIKGD